MNAEEINPLKRQLYDQNGFPIEDRDIVKVFHFVGARRRQRHYMYKQVRLVDGYWRAHHLETADFDPAAPLKNTYALFGDEQNNGILIGYEIVQSHNWRKLHPAESKAKRLAKIAALLTPPSPQEAEKNL